jgi:hypothetical protein
MIPRTLPHYVEQGGRQVFRPPYVATGAKLICFAVDADRDAIDDLLDRDLNEPAGGAVHYRCASPRVFFVFADIPSLSSVDLPDAGFGSVRESELSVWCLAADMTGVPTGATSARLVWFLPYVFTDSGYAIAAGREVFGYPKQAATITEQTTNGDWAISANAVGIRTYPARAELLEMVCARSVGGRQADNVFDVVAAMDLFGDLASDVTIDAGARLGGLPRPSATITAAGTAPLPPADRGGAWRRSPLSVFAGQTIRMQPSLLDMVSDPRLVFLKQFRDVECPTRACYQSIVEAGMNVTSGRAGRWNASACSVTVADYASHPLATDLGLNAGIALPCVEAFYAEADFTIELGREVWRAST